MSVGFVKAVLRENWYLAVLLVVLLGAGFYLQHRGVGVAVPAAPDNDPGQANKAAANDESPGRPSPQAEARAVIAKHKARFEENPNDKDAPALLNAMGNLYRQRLVDYPNAIQCYELLLHDYPDWEGIRTTLISLADCYQRQGDRDGVRRTYEAMTKKFPPDSQEFQYAQAQLSH